MSLLYACSYYFKSRASIGPQFKIVGKFQDVYITHKQKYANINIWSYIYYKSFLIFFIPFSDYKHEFVNLTDMCNCRVKPTIINTLPGDHKCLHLISQLCTEPSNLHFTDSHLEAVLLLPGWYLLETWTWNVLQFLSLILLCFVMLSRSRPTLTLEHCNIKTLATGHLHLQILSRYPPGMNNRGMVVQESLLCTLHSTIIC